MSDYVATVPLVLAGDGRFHGDAKNYAPVARTGDACFGHPRPSVNEFARN